MAITTGQNAEADDFINESERDATAENNAGKGVKLEGNGRFSSEFMPKRAAVRAYKNDSTTSATTSFVKITFGAEVFDTGGDFSGSTFTAPRDGNYLIAATCGGVTTSSSDTEVFTLAIYKNGTLYSQNFTPKTGTNTRESGATITDLLALSADDTIEIYIKVSSANVFDYQTGEDKTFICIQEMF